MKHSPLTLMAIRFTEVNIASTPDGDDSDVDKVDVEIELEPFHPPENKREWCVPLTVEFKPKDGTKAPYSGELEAFGFFSVSENWKENEIEKLVYINGGGIVYAAIREMLTNVTARGFFAPLILPSCSFAEMYKEMEEEKKKQLRNLQREQAQKIQAILTPEQREKFKASRQNNS